MSKQGIDALLVPRADEFLGEYIPEANERLRCLTDFTGSAGLAVVTATRAVIFVDGRYTVQVKQQINPSQFEIGDLGDAQLADWIASACKPQSRIAVDTRTVSQAQFANWKSLMHSMEWVSTSENLVDAVWSDRPASVAKPGTLHPESCSGESSTSKRKRIGEILRRKGLDALWVFMPESVSWLLNVRGSDIGKLPILQSHALISENGDLTWFVDPRRVPAGDWQAHVGSGVTLAGPEELASVLAAFRAKKVAFDPQNTNAASWQCMLDQGLDARSLACPVLLEKAKKNAVEMDGARRAHERDAVAKANFLAWLDSQIASGTMPNEAEVADRLHAFRSETPEFLESSFDTISAAGHNGALCHYNHRNSDKPTTLVTNSLYLVDSGGQYQDGTTDVTRTVAVGDVSNEMRRNFTLVLKGHIALARIRFPKGTSGMQLDALARQFLWLNELDFEHGTGHGVGSYLSVHEGPQRIAKLGSPVPLEHGMIVSNEPGYYAEGEYGIRCENLQMVVAGDRPGFYQFETLTLLPFDQRLIEPALLDEAEREWLNQYHARVWQTLESRVKPATREWLEVATAAL
jgi:Xaa-Pro aminopeptidase